MAQVNLAHNPGPAGPWAIAASTKTASPLRKRTDGKPPPPLTGLITVRPISAHAARHAHPTYLPPLVVTGRCHPPPPHRLTSLSSSCYWDPGHVLRHGARAGRPPPPSPPKISATVPFTPKMKLGELNFHCRQTFTPATASSPLSLRHYKRHQSHRGTPPHPSPPSFPHVRARSMPSSSTKRTPQLAFIVGRPHHPTAFLPPVRTASMPSPLSLSGGEPACLEPTVWWSSSKLSTPRHCSSMLDQSSARSTKCRLSPQLFIHKNNSNS
jgi:hypothetical protein